MYSNRPKLTQRQAEVLKFLQEVQENKGTAPTYREIAERFGFKSTKGASDHVRALERKGYVSLRGGRSRGIELASCERTPLNGTVHVSVLGDIQAGYPDGQNQRSHGTLAVDRAVIGDYGNHRLFALQVRGESMNGRGIYDADWIIADADVPPHEGDVVVALVDGQNTLKTLAKKNDRFYLKAENPDYPDITPMEHMTVQGTVKALLRQLS